MQLDPPIRVVVCDAEDLLADAATDAEFFANLPPETRLQRFARITFPARKLPRAGEVGPFQSSCHEK
jgi:hypothetical protein